MDKPKSAFRSIVGGRSFEDMYIKDWDRLKVIVDALKAIDAKVVLTQGVYDVYHPGHGAYLKKASELGDILIVGVDSDVLTKERKGPKRPLIGEDSRLLALSFLSSINFLTLRPSSKEKPLEELVRVLNPDILVTSETTVDVQGKILESLGPLCGKIITLPPQSTDSTSGRLRRLMIDGADGLAAHLNEAASSYLVGLKNGG